MNAERETWQQLAEDVGVYVVLPKSVGVLCELVMLGSESIKQNVKISFRPLCTKRSLRSNIHSLARAVASMRQDEAVALS